MGHEGSTGGTPLNFIFEQLWRPALQSPDLRIRLADSVDPGWADVESYWLLPSAQRARILISHGPRAGVSRLLTNYRRLREPRMNAVRVGLGAAARLGAPLSPHTVRVQRRRDSDSADRTLPLQRVEDALQRGRLLAAAGVRTSDNRKATLQLADPSGTPVGFAKFGWNRPTGALVLNEARTLRRLGDRGGHTVTPTVLATLDYFDNPVCVTSPLPLDVSRIPATDGLPQAQEIYDLLTVKRWDTLSNTGHFRQVRDRLSAAADDQLVRSVAIPAAELAATLSRSRRLLPVVETWHGDLTPWNCGRDSRQRLWVWDWEDAEQDALAGLDSVHWCVASARTKSGPASIDLGEATRGAALHLTALGIPFEAHGLVAAAYAVTMVDRACSLAGGDGTWRQALVQPDGLLDLLAQAHRLLASIPDR